MTDLIYRDQFGTGSGSGSDSELVEEEVETSGDGVDVMTVDPDSWPGIPTSPELPEQDPQTQGEETTDPSPDAEQQEQVDAPGEGDQNPLQRALSWAQGNPAKAGGAALAGVFLLTQG